MSVHYDRIIEQALAALTEGAVVCTNDGEQLGTVKEVRGESVKINASLQPDYWLSVMHILVREDGRIETSFAKAELGAYKEGAPAAPGTTPSARPTDDPAEPTVAPDPTRDADEVPPPVGAVSSGTGIVQVATTDTGQLEGGILAGDHLVGPKEQLEQRLRMEKELAAQRRELPHTHAEGVPDTSGTVGPPVEEEIAQIEATGEPIYETRQADTPDALKRAAAGVHRETEAEMRDTFSDLDGPPGTNAAVKVAAAVGAVVVGLVTLRWLRNR